MRLDISFPIPSCVGVRLSPKTLFTQEIKQFHSVRCVSTLVPKTNELQERERRSANYHPTVWEPKFIESLTTSYSYEFHGTKLVKLKEEVRRLFKTTGDPFVLLDLIDSIQRLGVSYHFDEEIRDSLGFIPFDCIGHDLYTTALQFRLLRNHGYPIGSDVFEKFKHGDGNLMEAISNDAEGLLSLFEASHYGMHGETDLEDAKNFSSKHLKSLIAGMEIKSAEKIQQSLEFPLHWRMTRLETRNFINLFDSDSTKNPLLLEFAKLDYNLVQSVHQKEVQELTRWWKNLGLKEKLSFSRDRLMENYLWTMGITSESQFSNCRIGLTKFVCILSAIDDMYDIYGSIDELERFTDAVNRWSIKAADDLPEYMKLCYLAMFNFGNEISYDFLRDHNLNVVYHIKEQWANLCRSYLVEARWFYARFIPTLDEYLENAWISVGGPAAIAHAYLWVQSPMTKTSLDNFKVGSQIIYWSSLIARLSNDLGTSKDEITRGDVAKSIQCYVKSEGVAEEHARGHIKGLISGSWRKLNEAITLKSHPKSIATLSLNMARTAQWIYQYGDGIGTSLGMTKDCLTSLIVDPIAI